MKLPRPGWPGTGNRWQSAPVRIQTIARTQNRLHDIQRRHFDQSVILLCVRWYLAYGLSLRDLNEMMAERGISVDHSTVHRWVVHFSPILLKRFNRRKRAVGSKWHMDETYIRLKGQWMYLYRAIDSTGDTVDFWTHEYR